MGVAPYHLIVSFFFRKEKDVNRRFSTIAFMLITAAMILAACAPATSPQQLATVVQTVIVQGTPQQVVVTATPGAATPTGAAGIPSTAGHVLTFNLGVGDIPSLDPSLAQDTSSIQVIAENFIGLTRLNEENVQVVPGMATSWDTSQDGKTITFHLRQNIPWVKWDQSQNKVVQVNDCNGKPRYVTAQDIVYGTMRTLAPATASPYAYVLNFVLAGANDYNSGKNKDPKSVGIKAVDANTVQMNFIAPAAYNINIAGMWVADAEPSWLIDGDSCTQAAGDRWTETGFFEAYGPYIMQQWVHDSYLTMVKNPFWPGTTDIPSPTIDTVKFTMLDTSPAFADYEAGNIDVTTVPLSEIDRVKADPVLSKQLHIAPSLATYFYGFNTTAPIVSDVRVRQALSMAIDRQSLVTNVTKGGQEPAQWLCRPGLVACPTMKDYPDLGIKYDPAKAKSLLDDYLKSTNQTAANLNLTLMFNTNEGHQAIAEAIQGMWKNNLGITVKLVNQEWKVYLTTIEGANTPQIYRLGWSADYPDANNFLKDAVGPGGNDNPVDSSGKPSGGLFWNDPAYNKIIDQAATETDNAKRVALYAQAEDILVNKDAVLAPIYWYTNIFVTKPNIQRTYSPTSEEHIEKWKYTTP